MFKNLDKPFVFLICAILLYVSAYSYVNYLDNAKTKKLNAFHNEFKYRIEYTCGDSVCKDYTNEYVMKNDLIEFLDEKGLLVNKSGDFKIVEQLKK